MIVEKEEKTSPEKVSSPKRPSFTLVLNGSPKNILKDALSPTIRSYLDILQSFPPTHIINTHANQLTVTALSVMYIGTRVLESGGYALSVVQNSTQESIQERIMNNRRTQHEPQQCRCVTTFSNEKTFGTHITIKLTLFDKKRIEEVVSSGKFMNQSEFVRHCIRTYFEREQWEKEIAD